MSTTAYRCVRLAFLVVLLAALCSCNLFRGSRGKPEVAVEPVETAQTATGVVDHEAALRAAVARHVESGSARRNAESAELIRRDPYYFREFVEYPDGAQPLDTNIRQTESRLAPQVADVTLSKVRYATQLKRKRAEAREDTDFFRETGTETLSFQLRHDKWRRVGSLFVVETRERKVDGQWVVYEEERRQPGLPEEDRGWLRGLWGSITGR